MDLIRGGHGCLVIPFWRGVCGAAARSGEIQCVSDVTAFKDHIACDSRTQSELVLPVYVGSGALLGVFDIDSHQRDAFDCRDAEALQDILAKTFSQVRDTPLSG